ncbi:alpha,alpha-phosphotrehalase [Lacrimispora defluvii]|uniref:Alpha,alpha-phosphotrehalase n=1 Tax=Lacrimispora defluvii TaxID=2719233 RepID=A0ABX1VJX8_9FIRM|nr:alpha,alpha-phosphotrehalase [Lacrimispora defluvii]NNJ28465.1 alpha,alpha-phosphotrehalase [Lacrimispora defluvii]
MQNFKKSCVYQIYPKSFMDTDGDGIGDLKGIIEKLDYLKKLGVDYLWLTPFFVSPQNDNGYDIEDYCRIDPLFGTMEDLDHLISEAKDRDMRLMLDMVFNHTSTRHEWFQRALAGEKKYQDYYFFQDGTEGSPPTNWQSKFGGNAWEYVEKLGKYYLHLYDVTQADLNWENRDVREEIKNVLRFWKEKGIRGFRFDVINLVSKPTVFEDDEEGDGRRFYTDGPRIHEFLREIVEDTGLDSEDVVTVGEMSSTTIDHCIRYTNPEEKQLKMCFNFHHLKVDYKDGDKWSLMSYDFGRLKKIFHTWQEGIAGGNGWNAVFWCNHDQPRAVSRFGDDGIFRKQSAKMLATVIHGMRGTPFIYQGEEIGMTNACFTDISQYRDVESLNYFNILKEQGQKEEDIYRILKERSRDNARTPMQWDGEENGGFTSGTPWLAVNKNCREINVKESLSDPDSIFTYYQKLVELRKQYDIISDGSYEPVFVDNQGIMSYKRVLYEEKLLVFANFTGQEQIVKQKEVLDGWEVLLSNYENVKIFEDRVTLSPFGAVMLYRKG